MYENTLDSISYTQSSDTFVVVMEVEAGNSDGGEDLRGEFHCDEPTTESNLDVTTATDGESFMLNSSISSTFSQSQSAAIRSSRRRAKKGTAVVLNTDRLQKYMMKEHHNESLDQTQATTVVATTVDPIAEEVDESSGVLVGGGDEPRTYSDTEPSSFHSDVNLAVAVAAVAANGLRVENSSTFSDNLVEELDAEVQIQRIKGEILANVQQLQRLQQQKQHQHSIVGSSTVPMNDRAQETDAEYLIRAAAATAKIQKNRRLHCTVRREKRLMYGAWTQRQSDLVFSMLLGHRIRWLMRSPNIAMKLKAMTDVRAVLTDLMKNLSVGGSNSFAATSSQFVTLWNKLHSPTTDTREVLLQFPKLPQTEVTLAKSLAKQFCAEKRSFLQLLYQGCKYRYDPAPGYYDFSAAATRALASAAAAGAKVSSSSVAAGKAPRASVTLSPMRDLQNSPKKLLPSETPPQLRNTDGAMREIAGDTREGDESLMPSPFPFDDLGVDDGHLAAAAKRPTSGVAASRPRPLKEILSSKSITQETNHSRFPISGASSESSEIAAGSESSSTYASDRRPFTSPSSAQERNIRPAVGSLLESNDGRLNRPHTSSHPSTPSDDMRAALFSTRKRTSARGHVQLDILSAEKLMPAKKVFFVFTQFR